MLKPYTKVALSFEDQLNRLQERGLQVADRAAAVDCLASISYYRLSAYWYPFRQRDAQGKALNQFMPAASFDEVVRLYEFDRRLRMAVLDAIERVEVAVRTRVTYHLAHQYGAFGHLDRRNFHRKFNHVGWLEKRRAATRRSSDEFVRHFKSHYLGFPDVPVWMLTEIMSLGALSMLYMGLRNNAKQGVQDKKAIADAFGLHHKRLGDWLHTLTYIRNICAHHSRLWNRELAIRPDKSKLAEWLPPVTPRNDRIFYVLLMLRYLLRSIGKGDAWAHRTTNLLEPIAQTVFYRRAMGMPEDWQVHPLWT